MEFFSPFLHSTGSLSVSWEYLALPGGPGEFRRNFSCSALLRCRKALPRVSHTGLSPSMIVLSRTFCYLLAVPDTDPITRAKPRPYAFGLCPVRSPLLGVSRLFSSPPVNEMFQFAGFASFSGYVVFNHVGCPIRTPPSQRL